MTVLQAKSEVEMYRAAFEHESQTTLNVLRAYPAAKADLKAAETSQRAIEIAWTLALCEGAAEPILRGEPMLKEMPPTPATWAEVITKFEDAHKRATARIATLKDEELNNSFRTMVGPKQEADVRVSEALWNMLMMSVHHRGQLSVYLRIAGGKVPSIYGPSADEKW